MATSLSAWSLCRRFHPPTHGAVPRHAGRKAYVARNWVCFLPRVVLPGPLLRWAEAAIIRSHLLVHDYSRTLTFGALAAVPGLEKVLRPHLVPTVRRTAVAYAVLSFPKERALKRRHMRAFPVGEGAGTTTRSVAYCG